MKKRSFPRPLAPSSPAPLHRAVLSPVPPLPPPVVAEPDPLIPVVAVEPQWVDGTFRDKGATFSVRLSEARRLGRIVRRL